MKTSFILCFLFVLVLLTSCKTEAERKKSFNENNRMNVKLIEKGKEIASTTFLALSSELQKAMKEGGVEHALSYCNENALAITDSLSKVHNVAIKRTSSKWRNPKNKPSEYEMKMLKRFEEDRKLSEMFPLLNSEDLTTTFYAPIIVQNMCLTCHGPKDEITNYNAIQNLYPDDMAFDYEQDDLRGMWSIQFEHKKNELIIK